MKPKIYCLVLLICLLVVFSTIGQTRDIEYEVKRGDNLSTIANKFNINIDRLIAENNLQNPNLITVGSKLTIPKNIEKYTVKKGDNLTTISRKFNISCDTIIKLNNISNPDKIYPGQELFIQTNKTSKTSTSKNYTVMSRNRRLSFIWPLQGQITSEFGWRTHPIKKTREFHAGIDIATPVGTPVFAAASGTVMFSGWASGYGNLVIIKHNNNHLTYYGHNFKLLVQDGTKIKQGKIIALSGNTGLSTGPHLHFEIRNNNNPINPLSYLNLEYLRRNFNI